LTPGQTPVRLSTNFCRFALVPLPYNALRTFLVRFGAAFAIALTLPAIGGALIRSRSDWELWAEPKTRVIPDALFEIRWDMLASRASRLRLTAGTGQAEGSSPNSSVTAVRISIKTQTAEKGSVPCWLWRTL